MADFSGSRHFISVCVVLGGRLVSCQRVTLRTAPRQGRSLTFMLSDTPR
jgi:hypothetical protein